MPLLKSLILAISALATLAALAHAQEGTITVSGNVSDASGAYVSAAEIKVTLKKCKCSDCKDPEKCDCCPNQLTAQTDEVGHFSFSVPHGTYLVDAKAGSREAHLVLDLNEGSAVTRDIRIE